MPIVSSDDALKGGEWRYPAASRNTEVLYGTGLAIPNCSLTVLMPLSPGHVISARRFAKSCMA